MDPNLTTLKIENQSLYYQNWLQIIHRQLTNWTLLLKGPKLRKMLNWTRLGPRTRNLTIPEIYNHKNIMNFHFTRINNFLKNCKKYQICLFENWPNRRFLNAYFIVYNVISWKLFAKFAEDRWRRPHRLRCSGKFWHKNYRRYSILFEPFLEPLGAEFGSNSFRSVINYETETTTLFCEENQLA